ncbi:hypothetical protein ACWGUN_05540 [Streptomyces koyangensis]|uniref:hypothetical protein n=1 Tax=Streptomyces TaxID=1883 RepID=UPI000C6D109D|nr:hypothetical protein [Streptomyces sp. EAG2]PKR43333.1 hypothetical protein CWE27_21005 [Streptomyces sp. EAG2]
MNRRPSPVPTALATAAVLLVSACGGESAGSDEKMPGAGESSAKSSASPSEMEEAKEGFDRPELTFPSDVEFKFGWQTPSEAKEAAVLKDTENYLKSIIYGITRQDPDSSAHKIYAVPRSQAATYAKDQVKGAVEAGNTVSGVQQFPYAQVKLSGTRTASVTYCQDESQFYSKSVKGGKVKVTKPSNNSYYSFTLVLEAPSASEGPWRAKAISGKQGVPECAA